MNAKNPIAATVQLLLALVLLVACLAPAWVSAQTPSATEATSRCPSVLRHQFPRLQDDAPQNLCQYAGKVILVVNTASYCGFTSQYQGLEALYAKYQAQGLVVLGFPSNDFGKQEPGSAKEIADLCFNTYGVKFPMFDKSVVSGKQANPLYQQLIKATGVTPQWNFHKYLIDRKGLAITSFPSEMTPQSKSMTGAIERLLAEKN